MEYIDLSFLPPEYRCLQGMLKGEHVKIVEEAFVAMMIIIIITIIIAVVRPTKRNFSWIMPDFKVTDRIY